MVVLVHLLVSTDPFLDSGNRWQPAAGCGIKLRGDTATGHGGGDCTTQNAQEMTS